MGVVEGSVDEPRLSYLTETVPVSAQLLEMSGTIKPTEIFRFAAHCEEHACRHFDGSRCRLATRIVQMLPAATEALPACLIRPSCRLVSSGRARRVLAVSADSNAELPTYRTDGAHSWVWIIIWSECAKVIDFLQNSGPSKLSWMWPVPLSSQLSKRRIGDSKYISLAPASESRHYLGHARTMVVVTEAMPAPQGAFITRYKPRSSFACHTIL